MLIDLYLDVLPVIYKPNFAPDSEKESKQSRQGVGPKTGDRNVLDKPAASRKETGEHSTEESAGSSFGSAVQLSFLTVRQCKVAQKKKSPGRTGHKGQFDPHCAESGRVSESSGALPVSGSLVSGIRTVQDQSRSVRAVGLSQ